MKFSPILLNEVADFEDLGDIDLDETADWSVLFDDSYDLTAVEVTSVSTEGSTSQPLIVREKRKYKKRVAKSSAAAVTVVTKPTPVRTQPKPKLYVFPSFDKSDAIIYLPSTIARLTNTGDIERLSKLIRGHCSKDCEIIMGNDKESGGLALPINLFMGLLECATILFPDIISCMHSTKVVGNQIHASMHSKYTDYAAMPDHARTIPRIRDDEFNNIVFTAPRRQALAQKLRLDAQPEHISSRIYELLDLEEELQVYMREDIVITLDLYTKKITSYRSDGAIVSVCHNGVQYKLI